MRGTPPTVLAAALLLAPGCGTSDSGAGDDGSGGTGTETGDADTETGAETGETETGDTTDEDDATDETGETGEEDTGEPEDPDAWWCGDPKVPIEDLESAVIIEGWGDFHEGWLFVEVGDTENECTVWADYPDCPNHWRVSIGLPPEVQKPGVYDTKHPDLQSYLRISFDGDPICGTFSEPAMDGSLQIISIDDEKIVGRLCNVPRGYGPDVNGTFTAYFCS